MFTASDFKLIERLCPMDLLQLLNLLGIDSGKLNFSGDEFKNYADLDSEIDKKLCAKLKSKSVLEGYAKLLDKGGITFDLSETRIDLLKKILVNREKIQAPVASLPNDFDINFYVGEPPILKLGSLSLTNLTDLKKFFEVSISAKSKIKKILREEFESRGMKIDEVSITIHTSAEKNSAPPSPPPPDEIFTVLEQVDKIFDKI